MILTEVESKPGAAQNPPSSKPMGRVTVRVPGVCGELVQGMLGNQHFLVTCPVDFYSRVTVEVQSGEVQADEGKITAPPDCPKSIAAVKNTLAQLEQENLDATLTISNPIPRGKGMGSSSADVIGPT